METQNPEDYLSNVNEAIKQAMTNYLRVCSTGGMPRKQCETILSAMEEAARLGYFSLSLAPLIAPGFRDTRRLDALEGLGIAVVENQDYGNPAGEHTGNEWSIAGQYPDVRAALDSLLPQPSPTSD
jgi:hypothetical protein